MAYRNLLEAFKEASDNVVRRKADRDATQSLIDGLEKEIADTTAGVNDVVDSIALVQNFSSNLRTDIVNRFEDLLTSGVREIFDKDYKIKIEFTTSGNSYHADFYMVLANGRKVSLAQGEGGGLKDFVSVLQRILYIILEPNKPARILFLDENLKALDSERAVSGFKFIAKLVKELDIQAVFITHSNAARVLLEAGVGVSVVEVTNDGTEAAVRPLEAPK
jgi:hypothetical protein